MRPSRIIVGEVWAEECLCLLLALNAGLPGMCTLHAYSAREALVKVCTLPLLAGEGYPARLGNICEGVCTLPLLVSGVGLPSLDRPFV
jgi:Flp pilus assembly CpaF family ATPase